MKTNVIMFIEKIDKTYKGHIFIDGHREMVNTDISYEGVKATMEWELNSVYNLHDCDITWLKCGLHRGCIK